MPQIRWSEFTALFFRRSVREIQGWPRSKKRGVGRVATGHSAGVKTLLERDYADLEPERKWVTDIKAP